MWRQGTPPPAGLGSAAPLRWPVRKLVAYLAARGAVVPHGTRCVQACEDRSMSRAGAPAERPARASGTLGTQKAVAPTRARACGDTCQQQRRASSTRSVGRRRCALWYTMIAGYSACTAACSAGGQLDQRSSLPSLPRTGAGRPVGASEPPRRSGVRAGFPVRALIRLSGRLVGCSGWFAAACWASALAGRWRVPHGLAARGVGSHRSSASSHARKHTTVQAYASARSPAAARMAAAPPLSVGAIARRAVLAARLHVAACLPGNSPDMAGRATLSWRFSLHSAGSRRGWSCVLRSNPRLLPS